jgi:phosphate acetyltransferase
MAGMKRTLYLAPAGARAGLTTVTLGLVRALDRMGVRVAFYKPIGQTFAGPEQVERSTHFARATTKLPSAEPIPSPVAAAYLSDGRLDELLARVMDGFQQSSENADLVVVEGLVSLPDSPYAESLNAELVKALTADIVLVGSLANGQLKSQLELAARPFGSIDDPRLVGCVLNRVQVPADSTLAEVKVELRRECEALRPGGLPLIGVVPENAQLTYCRAIDLVRPLGATIYHRGDLETRRVKDIVILARSVPNLLRSFRPGAALVTPTDRTDVIIAISHAALNGVPLAALILTSGPEVDQRVLDFCKPGFDSGLPVFMVATNSYDTGIALNSMTREVPVDDLDRMHLTMDFVAGHIDARWLEELPSVRIEARMSPAAFCHMLTERARRANKRILLPEGDEPRTIRAAIYCQERRIARCVLIGKRKEIERIAHAEALVLPEQLEIIDPDAVRDAYVAPLVEFRKSKNLSAAAALDQLTDNVMLGTVMLALGQGDGLVSGAVHSSANTVRPALQIIRTRPDAKVVSSIFFMCLPDQVVAYGDCAINTDPDAETLADIAIQSADSVAQFGIPPRVAMISYSTGESGSGVDVDKVREATRIAKAKRPDLLIDGPLQYDAAASSDVAALKAPKSPVAGRATVFIFPDLNTGNTTYKAVQRSAHVISIGPMLQGLKRPVNDLSRGALVEDIIYTIALTAIQAEQSDV